MDTLAQNVVGVSHKLEEAAGDATIPRSNIYATWRRNLSGDVPGDQFPWPTMISAINYGMSYTASMFWAGSNLFVDCRTGNCTFGPYQSLTVGTQCHETTNLLDIDADNISLPDGPYLRSADGILNVSSTTEYPTADYFTDIGPLILNFQAIARPVEEEPTAIHCVMYWAVGTYLTTNMTNYTLYELDEVLWTNTSQEAKTSLNQTDHIWLVPPECWVNGTKFSDKKHDQCENFVHSTAQLGLQVYTF